MQRPISPVGNKLLDCLPAEVLAKLDLTFFDMVLRTPLHRARQPIQYVYFPIAGMISMVAEMDDGTQVEVGLVGREGMLGTVLLSGKTTSFAETMVQMPGAAWRMPRPAFMAALNSEVSLRQLLMLYNEALQSQVMQTAACNGRHSMDRRLARWLLMAHDRAISDELPLTQDFMAAMLGVHRPTVTVAARALQHLGVIKYNRDGRVIVLDRSGLEAAACECYGAVKRRFSDLMDEMDLGPM